MRTIKFKLWDGYKIQDVGSIVFHTDESYHVNEEYPVNDKTANEIAGTELDYKLMQFTGLLDVSGKEIYEGDILGNTEHAVVEFFDGAFRIRGYVITEWFGVMEKRQIDYNVIGNIYENPELLT